MQRVIDHSRNSYVEAKPCNRTLLFSWSPLTAIGYITYFPPWSSVGAHSGRLSGSCSAPKLCPSSCVVTRSASFFEHEKKQCWRKKISPSRTGQKIPATSRPPSILRYTEMDRDLPMNILFVCFRSVELKASKIMVHFQRQVPGLCLNTKPLLKAKCCPTIPTGSYFQCNADASSIKICF